MSKNKFLLICCFSITIALSACNKHQHTLIDADCSNPAICSECNEILGEALGHTSAVGVCSRCGEIGNEDVLKRLNEKFTQMIDVSTPLFSCLSGVSSLKNNEQYECFLEADKYTAEVTGIYEDIINICTGIDELNTIVYQINLLKNISPSSISDNDPTFLANQAVSYQLYLQQLSSSCSCISEIMDYLSGNREIPTGTLYFEEASDIPTPDSCIYGISFNSCQEAPGNIQYMYLLGSDETDAMLNYNLYLSAVSMNEDLQVNISDSMAIVKRNGSMISAMMPGNDSSIGYFLMVTFQN